MLRVVVLVGITIVAIGCSTNRDLNATDDTRPGSAARASNQLVHVQGKFISFQRTGKRHQSYIFTFRIQDGLHGPWQAPTPMDELVRFELYHDFGGGDLVAKLIGENSPGAAAYAEVDEPVTDTHAYQLVLWRLPSFEGQQIDAQLVGVPVQVRE